MAWPVSWFETYEARGWIVLPPTPESETWAEVALSEAFDALPDIPSDQWRSGDTWCVGLDLLDNDTDGALRHGAVPLASRALARLRKEVGSVDLHRAQVSVVKPGYPQPMPGESDAAFRFRQNRDAAHVDGLRKQGDGTRTIAELHDFVLGVPLTSVARGASPLVVYDGSHVVMAKALRGALQDVPEDRLSRTDVTQAYAAARKAVFEHCARIEIDALPGAEILLHRHTLHGIARWTAPPGPPDRLVAYFRPASYVTITDWLGTG